MKAEHLVLSFGGGLSAMMAHLITFPFDVQKVRRQVDRSWLPMHEGFIHGLAANLVGWGLHGVVKFMGYTTLKEQLHGTPLPESRVNYYLVSSLLAETVATVVLAPFDVCTVRIIADPLFAPSVVSALFKIIRTEGVRGLVAGLPFLLLRQLILGFVKFHMFERFARKVFDYLDEDYTVSRQISKPRKLIGVFLSSLVTSLVSVTLSHPLDVLFTHHTCYRAFSHLNLFELFTGWPERIISNTTNNFLIWYFYDGYKMLLRM